MANTRSDLSGARICVAGLGTSGRAALDTLVTLGINARGLDTNAAAIEAATADLDSDKALDLAKDSEEFAALATRDSDIIIASPGIGPSSALYRQAGARGIPIWSEIELAWQLQAPRPDGSYAPWLTLTGTNGKTTTVTMTSAILHTAGLIAPAVGNVGTPAVTIAAIGGVDALCVELSSFQLHSTYSVSALASACLNIDADHLDWHGSYESYKSAKARVHERTSRACLYSRHDQATRHMVETADVIEGARAISIGSDIPPVAGIGYAEGLLIDRAYHPNRQREAEELAAVSDLDAFAAGGQVPDHILLDAAFAAGLARALDVPAESVGAGLRAYAPGAHRAEAVAKIAGVRYINDSKATNAHAARASLLAHDDGTVVWIAGGLAKGARFDQLVDTVGPKLKAAIIIGVDQEPFTAAFAGRDTPVHFIDPATSDPLAAAVDLAARLSAAGDAVVLAPACASMDQFTSYAERGQRFAALVRQRAN